MTEKRCYKCGEWKLFSEFYKDKYTKGGLRSECKICGKQISDKWHKEHPGYSAQYIKEWRKENPDYDKTYRAANIERDKEVDKRWQQQNKERSRLATAKRRAAKKSVSTTDPWEIQQIAIFYGDCPKNWHVDHIIPLALGGRHELSNLQHLKNWMNWSKNDTHPDNWDDPRPISCRA